MYVDILEVEAGSGNDAGIVAVGSIPGMVPFYEEHVARRKAGYTIPEWRDQLTWVERAIEIAMFRVDARIETIMMEENRRD